jgi:hypothetical protein
VQATTRNRSPEFTAHFHGVGYALWHDGAATTCDITGTDCYKARVVPSITSIDHSTGYTSGGQTITITGHALDGIATETVPGVAVTVGGAPCTVKTVTDTQITCETTETTVPTDNFYAGSNGLHHVRFNDTIAEVMNSVGNDDLWQQYIACEGCTEGVEYIEDLGEEYIMTSLEIAEVSNYWQSRDIIRGYFVAPVDGEYQFHMSSDDQAYFRMSNATDPVESMDPANKMDILTKSWWNGFRAYKY